MINVVITTKSLTKCIFLNFGAILKRMAKIALNSQKLLCRLHIKFIYKNKIKLFTEKKKKLEILTLFLFLLFLPYPSFPLPLIIPPPPRCPPCGLIFPTKYLKHTFSKEIFWPSPGRGLPLPSISASTSTSASASTSAITTFLQCNTID